MANINFPQQQQPSRSGSSGSITATASNNQPLPRNASNNGSSSVLSTLNMFPCSMNSSINSQQLSSNQNGMPILGNRTIFSQQQQRSFPMESRPIGSMTVQDWNSSSVSNLGSIGQSSRTFNNQNNNINSGGASSNFQSMFNSNNISINNPANCSISCQANSRPLLNLSEFPSLTNDHQVPSDMSSLPQQLNPSSVPGKQPYVGMVKAPTTETNEFMMSSADFPALPGTQSASLNDNNSMAPASSSSINSEKLSNPIIDQHYLNPSGSRLGNTSAAPGAEKHQLQQQQQLQAQLMQPQSSSMQQYTLSQQHRLQQAQQQEQRYQQQQQLHQQYQQQQEQNVNSQKLRCVQTYPSGKVTNIPSNMMKDQFGILGLLTFIRAAESDKNVVSLALGQDLTALGLNLNNPGDLHPSFAGPWTVGPVKPQEVEHHLPQDYLINQNLKLPDVKLSRYKDDLLFFLFYMFAGDTIQLAAASELYNREWRFHMEEKVWICQMPGLDIIEKTTTYERGVYYFFDAQSWKKVAKEFHLEYSKLEGKPVMPPNNM